MLINGDMKKRILIIFLLCIVCCIDGAYAQKKKGKRTTHGVVKKGKGKKKKGGKKVVVIPPPPSLPGPTIDTPKRVIVAAAPPVPFKKFDRPVDGYYKKNNILNAKVKPYPFLREVDVAYSKRVWRDIDLRE